MLHNFDFHFQGKKKLYCISNKKCPMTVDFSSRFASTRIAPAVELLLSRLKSGLEEGSDMLIDSIRWLAGGYIPKTMSWLEKALANGFRFFCSRTDPHRDTLD